MKRNKTVLKLFALLCILLALYGCQRQNAGIQPSAQPPAELQALLDARAEGINSKNQQEYLATVLPSDAVLMKEESNLIRAAASLDIKDFKLTAGEVTPAKDGGYTALLWQTYTVGGKLHRCAYEAAFRTENNRLYYCGPDFKLKQNNLVKVHYSNDKENLAQQLLNTETQVLANMKEQLGFTPAGTISIKLFDDQQVFLQSVKLDLPDWVGGWHEYGEAIKSTGGYGTEGSAYMSMLSHESTHRMVSELSNDNASYWMQEGLASAFESGFIEPAQGWLTPDELLVNFTPYAKQKNVDLEKLDMEDGGAVMLYYTTSKAYAAFLLETYGWDKVKQALEYMKKFELIPVTGAEKINETNKRTDEALQTVLGFGSDESFQAAFDKWLEGKRK